MSLVCRDQCRGRGACALLLVFVLLLGVSSVSAERRTHAETLDLLYDDFEELTNPGKTALTHSGRRNIKDKRGIVSGLIVGVSILTKVTATGLTIASAVTGGCSYFKSICTNKDAIEELDKQIQEKKKVFQEKFDRNREHFLTVREATNLNKEILYYLDEAFQAMTEISRIEDDINSVFMAELPKLHKMFMTNSTDAEDYLVQVMSPLQYRLSDLKNQISATSKSLLIGLAVQYLVEMAMSRVVKTFTRSYNNVQYDLDSAEGFRFFMRDVMSVDEEALEKYTQETKDSWKQTNKVKNPSKWQKLKASVSWQRTKQRFKFSGKVLKDLGLRLNNYVKVSVPRKARLWWRVLPGTKTGSWKGFKGKFNHEFIKPIKAKMASIGNKIKSPMSTLRGVKLDWSGKLMTGLSVIGDLVNVAMQILEWKKVADQMDKARIGYEYYLGNLTYEVEAADEEYANLTIRWDEQLEDFPKMVSSLTGFIQNVTQYEDFGLVDNTSAAKLPVDPDMVFFHTDLDSVTKDNLIPKQKIVLDAIKLFNNNLTAIMDDVNSRFIFYSWVNHTLNETLDRGEEAGPASELLTDIKAIYKFQKDGIKQYGNILVEYDILCVIAIIFPEVNKYDFFPLGKFRPDCKIDPTEYANMQEAAENLRYRAVLLNTATRMAQQNKPITAILDQVKFDYTSRKGKYATYGNALGERDVVCAIAEVLPTKSDYKFYNLGDFRPTCPSQAEFDTLKGAVDKVKAAYGSIEGMIMNFKKYGFVPCEMQAVADGEKISVADARNIVKEVVEADPDLTEICSKYCPSCLYP